MKIGRCLGWIALVALPAATAEEWRTFSDPSGRQIRAALVAVNGAEVRLRREDGQEFDLAIERLSVSDREDVAARKEAMAAATQEKVAPLNQAAGHELFAATPLFERQAEEIAAALGLRPESRTAHSGSWRTYAAFVQGGYRLFGAMPFSVALYGDGEGRATHLSAVFANKGDFGSRAGFAAEHFSAGAAAAAPGSLAEAMARDEQAIVAAIEPVLGPARQQRYGEGKSRRTIRRWDFEGQAILLSVEENEYVGLSVVPTVLADAKGRTERLGDEALKRRLAENVVRADNGDVVLSNVPMVDQGPKGYCVPATFERAMRYMGLDADMYLLAMVGQTSAGGGTVVEELLANVRSQVYQKGRRTRDVSLRQFRLRDFRRYLDEGVPVMWVMDSTDLYNAIADRRTEARKHVSDWAEYAAEVTAEAEMNAAKLQPDRSRGHICMIVGYNEKTGEIAVSDSWGPSFALRWIHADEAAKVSAGSLFIILP